MIRIKATATKLENALVFRDRFGQILCRISEEIKMDLRAARSPDVFTDALAIFIFEMEGMLGDEMTAAERTFVETRLRKYVWGKP